jgi:SSS family solute:Na+ symporter
MRLGPLDASIVVAYLIGMVGVGAFVARRIGGFRDFFVAGGRMTTPLLVCTLVSTYYGLDVTFGTSETAFDEGVAAFCAYSAPFYLAYACMALFVAPRLKALPALSLPEAMGHFYGRPARLAAALASFVYSAPILSVFGMGLIGEVFLGVDPLVGAAVGAAVALVYTVLGGLLADALTDTVQFTLMCVTVAVAAGSAMLADGTPDALALRLDAVLFEAFGGLSPAEILVYAGVALTPLVEPAFYQRTFAARGSREIVRALLLGIVLWIAYDWLVVYLGITGRDLVARGELPAGLDGSAILLHVVAHLLPAGLLGLFLAGCLASAMSTIDSYSLIAAGNLVYDGWQPLARRPLPDRTLLRATRIAVAFTLVAALFLALRFGKLRDAWIFMATVLLSTALVPMGAALFVLRRRRPRAGSCAACTGLASSAILFACFEAFGEPGEETLVLATRFGWTFEREAALLWSLPLSLMGFLLGYAADLHREART